MNKKLYRSEKNKIIAGVIGGLGEFLDVDPVLLRLIWVLLVVFTAIFPGIFAYLLAIMVVPLRPYQEHGEEVVHEHRDESKKTD